MTHHFPFHTLAVLALAGAMLAGCGGGDAGAPPPPPVGPVSGPAATPDKTPPTMTIANDTPAAVASGTVTFTFVFSEDVVTSFTSDDITVTGGTKGTFNRVSGSLATLVVEPTPNATGTIVVTVPAGKFVDIAGNANTTEVTASKDYNTLAGPSGCGIAAPTCAPATTIPAGAITIYSDAAAAAGFNPFPNWGQPTQFSEANIAGNKSLKYTGLTYEGIEFTAVDVSAKGKVHFDFWTPDLAAVKVSIISPGKENAVTKTLTAGTWNSIDIDLSQYTVPDLKGIFQIKLESAGAAGTLYVDNIHFWGSAAANVNADMGSGGLQTLRVASGDVKTPNGGLTFFVAGEGIFALDYKGGLDAQNNFASWTGARTDGDPTGGAIGYYQDDATLSNNPLKVEEGGWVAGTSLDANGAPNFFRYFIMKATSIPASYMGLYVNAANNGYVDVHSFQYLKLRMWGPHSMYELSFHPQGVEVVLSGPKVAGCNATGSGGTEIRQTFDATQTIGAASVYKLPLSGFTVKGLCGSDTNSTAVASVLSHLARVAVTVPGTAFNFTLAEPNTNPALYAIGLNLSTIGFTNTP